MDTRTCEGRTRMIGHIDRLKVAYKLYWFAKVCTLLEKSDDKLNCRGSGIFVRRIIK